jgi:predicted DNA-binding transcriptional regulator YafY
MSYSKARELLDVALFIAGRDGTTLADVEMEFGCERRRVQRMLEALRDLFPQLERTVDEERRPRWRLPAASLSPFLAPTPDELVSLTKAIELMASGSAAVEAPQLRSLERKLRAGIPLRDRARLAVDEEALLESMGLAARPGPRPFSVAHVDEVISHALKSRQLLHINYASRADGAPHWRRIEPYGLLLGSRRYLVGRDTDKGTKLRYYRVEAIEDARADDHHFEPAPDIELGVQAKRGFGSFERSQEFGPVAWRFVPSAAAHARRVVFHPDQTFEQCDDGSLIVRFSASGHLEMAWHLYAWGDKVEVLEPSELAALVKNYQRGDFPGLP